MKKFKLNPVAADVGKADCKVGYDIKLNPYKPESDNYYSWRLGWSQQDFTNMKAM